MATIPISDELVERLQEIARQQNRPIQEFLETVADQYEVLASSPRTIQEDPRYKAAEKRIRPKLYARARRYWQQTGNQERLALSDAQLDEQFWLFDQDGIPRLKSEQATITIPDDPLEKAANQAWQMALKEGRLAEAGTQDFDTRAILQNEYPEYLMRRMQADNGE